jgi:hypothetical protein
MKYFATVTFLLTSIALAAPASEVNTLALGKANEYTEADWYVHVQNDSIYSNQKVARTKMEATNPLFPVYIATSPGQKVHAYSNGACNPHADKSGYLGQLGGACQNLPSEFPSGGAIQSVQFYTPVVCNIVDMFKDLPENVAEAAKDILDIII